MSITVNGRKFAIDQDQFGTIMRANVLGLDNAPAILMDDGSYRAYFGNDVHGQLVDPATGTNGEGQAYSLPLDVKIVAHNYLSNPPWNMADADQEALLRAWMSLDAAQRTARSDIWLTVDKANQGAVVGFINDLVAYLQALGIP